MLNYDEYWTIFQDRAQENEPFAFELHGIHVKEEELLDNNLHTCLLFTSCENKNETQFQPEDIPRRTELWEYPDNQEGLLMSCQSVPAPWCDLLMCQQLSLGRPECPAFCEDSLDESNAMKDPPQTELKPRDLGFQAAQLKHRKLTTSNKLIAFCHTKPKTIQHTVYFVPCG